MSACLLLFSNRNENIYPIYPRKIAINMVGSRSPAMFSKPNINPKMAVIQLGKGGFSYLGSSFMVVNNQLPSVIISRAVMKFLASMIVTGITLS